LNLGTEKNPLNGLLEDAHHDLVSYVMEGKRVVGGREHTVVAAETNRARS